jgi:hypothetical protein
MYVMMMMMSIFCGAFCIGGKRKLTYVRFCLPISKH